MRGTETQAHSGVGPRVGSLALLLAVALTATSCEGWIPLMELPEGNLELHNRSDQAVHVYIESSRDRDPRRTAVIEPGEQGVFWSMGEGAEGECVSRLMFILRDEGGRELATSDEREEPLCDGEPWVWEGPPEP